jgi:hypothetical protein
MSSLFLFFSTDVANILLSKSNCPRWIKIEMYEYLRAFVEYRRDSCYFAKDETFGDLNHDLLIEICIAAIVGEISSIGKAANISFNAEYCGFDEEADDDYLLSLVATADSLYMEYASNNQELFMKFSPSNTIEKNAIQTDILVCISLFLFLFLIACRMKFI